MLEYLSTANFTEKLYDRNTFETYMNTTHVI